MINVRFHQNQRGYYRFIISNHGDELVCSAVSSLVINALNFIELSFKVRCAQQSGESGFIDFSFAESASSSDYDKALLMMEFVLFGLREIQKAHRNQLRITIVND